MPKKSQSAPRPKRPAKPKAVAGATSRRDEPKANVSKLDQIVAALRAPKGASISDLMRLTGWQMHSVRGAIAGALKKKRGLAVTSQRAANGERIYRIAGRP